MKLAALAILTLTAGTSCSPAERPQADPLAVAVQTAPPAAPDSLAPIADELRLLLRGGAAHTERETQLWLDSLTVRARGLRSAAGGVAYAALVDSVRAPLRARYANLFQQSVGVASDLDSFFARYKRDDGTFDDWGASGPALSQSVRRALADLEDMAYDSELWSTETEAAFLGDVDSLASRYENWKYISHNVTPDSPLLVREWSGLSGTVISPDFLANGRLRGGGLWWTKPGSTQGGQYNTLCAQEDRAGPVTCDAYLIEHQAQEDGGGWILYWGAGTYEPR
jgi:hypothetical protein